MRLFLQLTLHCTSRLHSAGPVASLVLPVHPKETAAYANGAASTMHGHKKRRGHKAGRGDDSTWQTTRHKCNKKRETVHMQMRGTGEDCGFGGRMKGCSVQLGHKESLRNALGALFSFSAARWVGVHARRATMLRPAGDSPVPGERTVPASTCTWPGNHCEMQIWWRRLGWTGLGRDNKRSLWG